MTSDDSLPRLHAYHIVIIFNRSKSTLCKTYVNCKWLSDVSSLLFLLFMRLTFTRLACKQVGEQLYYSHMLMCQIKGHMNSSQVTHKNQLKTHEYGVHDCQVNILLYCILCGITVLNNNSKPFTYILSQLFFQMPQYIYCMPNTFITKVLCLVTYIQLF